MRSPSRMLAAGFTALALGAAPAHAQSIFQGLDTGGSNTTRAPLVNSLNAESLFLSNLIGVGTETFDTGFTLGSTAPLGLNFGAAGTATLNGGGCVSNWTWSACSNQVTGPGASQTGTNAYGRYSVNDPNLNNGGKYWETSTNGFSINFTNPIAAFGFFGIDIGEFGGTLSLAFKNGVSTVATHALNFGSSQLNGSAYFWGIIDTNNVFDQVVFNVSSGDDLFAFDNMTIGTVEQVGVVPEPSTYVLLATGLLFVVIAWRRRREDLESPTSRV